MTFLIPPPPPRIENLAAGTTVRTPWVIVRGTASGADVKVGDAAFPVKEGRFAALAALRPGDNTVRIDAGGASATLSLRYVPMRNPRSVRVVYLLARDELPYFLGQGTPLGDSAAAERDIRARAGTMARAIQAFSADSMAANGYGPLSFRLDEERGGAPKIEFVRVEKTGVELRRMDGNALYAYFEPILSRRLDSEKTKVLALIGATRYDPATKSAAAHTALGGGSLALFGSGPMRFWPASLRDLPAAFLDGRKVDPAVEFDDSGLRSRAWANAATTYGATLHELGHAFGLPHSPERLSIMSRGFDRINRAWMAAEPAGEPALAKPFDPASAAKWDPAWAARLSLSPWFQPDGTPAPAGEGPTIAIEGDEARIGGTAIRLVGEWIEGPRFGVSFAESHVVSKATRWPLAKYLARLGAGEKLHLFATDAFGRTTDVIANP